MASKKIFLRKKFSDYLGEERAILDIVVGREIVPSPTPTPSPTFCSSCGQYEVEHGGGPGDPPFEYQFTDCYSRITYTGSVVVGEIFIIECACDGSVIPLTGPGEPAISRIGECPTPTPTPTTTLTPTPTPSPVYYYYQAERCNVVFGPTYIIRSNVTLNTDDIIGTTSDPVNCYKIIGSGSGPLFDYEYDGNTYDSTGDCSQCPL